MIRVTVDGIGRDLPLGPDASLEDAIGFIHKAAANGNRIVRSIRVDGADLDDRGDAAMEKQPLSSFLALDVTTALARELAEETLRDLDAFTRHLEGLSRAAAGSLHAGPAPKADFNRFLDGIDMFSEAVLTVRDVLRAPRVPDADLLQVDLLSILQDLLSSIRKGESAYCAELLSVHIPENLLQWREKGIPALVRCRDS